MNYLRIVGIAVTAAMAITASIAGTASATTLEVNGVAQTGAVTVSASLVPGSSSVDSNTDGSLSNTCTESTFHGSTTVFTGAALTLPLSGMTFSSCARARVVDKPGTLSITHIAGTTNGTVTMSGTELTISSPLGTITCRFSSTHIGTLTGATTVSNPGPHAKLDVFAVLNCGFVLPSWKWTATYVITTPTDLGVVA